MSLTPTTSLGQGILDPTVKSRTAAIIRQKIKQGERDMNKLASEAFWDVHRMDQWGRCKLKLPSAQKWCYVVSIQPAEGARETYVYRVTPTCSHTQDSTGKS